MSTSLSVVDVIDVSSYPGIHRTFVLFGIPCFFFNLFGIYVIYVATPKRIGNYKFFLMAMQINGTIFDFVCNLVAFPIFSFPAGGAYFLGFASGMGIPGLFQAALDLTLFLYFVAIIGVTIFQKQQSILPEGHLLKLEKRFKFLVELVILSNPLIIDVVLALLLPLNSYDRDNYAMRFPQMRAFIQQPNYYGIDGEMLRVLVPLHIFYFSLFPIIGSALIFPTYLSLYQQQHLMSERTLRFQRKWLRNLNFQVATFIILVLIPIGWFLNIGSTQDSNLSKYSIWPTMIAVLHGTCSTIVLLLFYDAYREYVIDLVAGKWTKQRRQVLGIGVVDGVEGVVTKPIEGAKQDGC